MLCVCVCVCVFSMHRGTHILYRGESDTETRVTTPAYESSVVNHHHNHHPNHHKERHGENKVFHSPVHQLQDVLKEAEEFNSVIISLSPLKFNIIKQREITALVCSHNNKGAAYT